MNPAHPRDAIYRGRVFDCDVIELCVRWYISYRLSYRDLVEITAERGVQLAHTTILRWVLRYVPEYEKRWSRFSDSPLPHLPRPLTTATSTETASPTFCTSKVAPQIPP